MQVQKLRAPNGLIPAGAYFAAVAHALENANAQEAKRREVLDGEDRRLEARYRRASAARSNTFAGGYAVI